MHWLLQGESFFPNASTQQTTLQLENANMQNPLLLQFPTTPPPVLYNSAFNDTNVPCFLKSLSSLNMQDQAALEMDPSFEGNSCSTLASSITKVTKSAEKKADLHRI